MIILMEDFLLRGRLREVIWLFGRSATVRLLKRRTGTRAFSYNNVTGPGQTLSLLLLFPIILRLRFMDLPKWYWTRTFAIGHFWGPIICKYFFVFLLFLLLLTFIKMMWRCWNMHALWIILNYVNISNWFLSGVLCANILPLPIIIIVISSQLKLAKQCSIGRQASRRADGSRDDRISFILSLQSIFLLSFFPSPDTTNCYVVDSGSIWGYIG